MNFTFFKEDGAIVNIWYRSFRSALRKRQSQIEKESRRLDEDIKDKMMTIETLEMRLLNCGVSLSQYVDEVTMDMSFDCWNIDCINGTY